MLQPCRCRDASKILAIGLYHDSVNTQNFRATTKLMYKMCIKVMLEGLLNVTAVPLLCYLAILLFPYQEKVSTFSINRMMKASDHTLLPNFTNAHRYPSRHWLVSYISRIQTNWSADEASTQGSQTMFLHENTWKIESLNSDLGTQILTSNQDQQTYNTTKGPLLAS